MNASFYDLLKYARTGIASPDMTAYDKLRALAIGGGFPVRTIEGVPPISFTGDGKPLISVDVFGNSRQTGTPSPQNLIMPEFVGVRTGNLFDKNSTTTNEQGASRPGVTLPSGTYSISNGSVRAIYYRVGYSGTSYQINADKKVENIVANDDLYVWQGLKEDGVMVNTGKTVLPYEPYGMYKIPITCASQTVPVYLGQTVTTRRVRKLVLTGEEAFYQWDNGLVYLNYTVISDADRTDGAVTSCCSHFKSEANRQYASQLKNDGCAFRSKNVFFAMKPSTVQFADLAEFTQWVSQQYAAGTPVTVWYVLAEQETGIVNEPLAKIGDYADELHSTDAGVTIPTAKGQNTLTVDTDLPPSSVSITGNIK